VCSSDLETFSKFLELEINQEKSPATFSKICANDHSLHNILNFPIKTLPISYLGLPITGRKKTQAVCWKFVDPNEKMLGRWKGRCLSYVGRTQLVNWMILGKFQYWANGSILPCTFIKKIQSLAYNFIWDGRRCSSWEKMALPKKKGGIRVKDFFATNVTALVKRAKKFWNDEKLR